MCPHLVICVSRYHVPKKIWSSLAATANSHRHYNERQADLHPEAMEAKLIIFIFNEGSRNLQPEGDDNYCSTAAATVERLH